MGISVAKRVYQTVQQIPPGKVMTYGQIAKLAGIKSPRLVGRILHQNPDPVHVPCHRVVSARGKLAANFAFGGLSEHSRRLKRDGLKIAKGVVDLKTYLWHN